MEKFVLSRIKGVIPAMLTVFDENEKVDEQGIRSLTEHLISKRIDGLYLTGSTGESFLMTGDERKKVVETVIDQVKGRIPVIVHVGDIGTIKSIDNAVHAYKSGADAISSVPPFYWNFTQKQIFNYYKDLSESTPLPMIVYNVKMAGAIGLETIKELSSIENVKGIKYTLTSHFEMQQIKEQLGDDFILYSGCDQMAASGLLMGADGIIGSFYNLMPEIFIEIYNAVRDNDMRKAKERQKIATSIVMHCVKYNFFSFMRAGLSWLGVRSGYCRRPFGDLSEEELGTIKKELIALREEMNITGVDFMEKL